MTDEEVRDLIRRARLVAKGSLDPIFDSISDCELILAGEKTPFANGLPEAADQLKAYVVTRERP